MMKWMTNQFVFVAGLAAAMMLMLYGAWRIVNPIARRHMAELATPHNTPRAYQLVISRKPIGRGQTITADDLQIITMQSPPPSNAATRFTAVVGTTALTDIPAHQLMIADLYASDPGRAALAYDVPPGTRAIDIRTDDEIAVGNFITPKDHIDIAVVLPAAVLPKPAGASNDTQGNSSEAHILLQDIPVLAVGSSLQSSPAAAGKSATNRGSAPRSLVVALTPDQITEFILARALGSYYLLLRNPSDPQLVPAHTALLADLRNGNVPATSLARGDRPIELITGSHSQIIYSQSREVAP